jgi:hypothetical protein
MPRHAFVKPLASRQNLRLLFFAEPRAAVVEAEKNAPVRTSRRDAHGSGAISAALPFLA